MPLFVIEIEGYERAEVVDAIAALLMHFGNRQHGWPFLEAPPEPSPSEIFGRFRIVSPVLTRTGERKGE